MKKTDLQLTNKTKAFLKDLELQIDYLVGYAPQGLHWKQEYHFRQELIDNTLTSDETPNEVRQKIYTIQDTIYRLQNNIKHEQIYYTQIEQHINTNHKPIKVFDWQTQETYFI